MPRRLHQHPITSPHTPSPASHAAVNADVSRRRTPCDRLRDASTAQNRPPASGDFSDVPPSQELLTVRRTQFCSLDRGGDCLELLMLLLCYAGTGTRYLHQFYRGDDEKGSIAAKEHQDTKERMIYMMFILRKNRDLFSTSSSSSSSSLYFLPRNRISSISLYFHHFSSAAAATVTATETPGPQPSSFIVDYLINSCGFSRQRAATASKRISHLTSPTQPDSVTHFLKHHGFDDAQVRTIIYRYPRILCADAGRTVEPNLAALREVGLAEDELRRLVVCNPQALHLRAAAPRLEFWRTFLNGDTKKLLLAFTRNLGLINVDVHNSVSPKIALLKDYGLSESDIGLLVVRGQCFINRNTATIKSLLKRVEDFGFPRGSRMFLFSLSSFSGIGSDTLKAKMEIYRSFGWSQEDLVSAMLKAPLIVRFSEKNIRAKVEFLVETAGCTQKYIALHPTLLGYSLEKRLIPRHQVMKILKSKGLFLRMLDLYAIICLTEKDFLDSIAQPYKDSEPALFETYFAACAGKLVDWTARRVIS